MNFPDLLEQASEVHYKDNKKWWTDLETGEYPIYRDLGELKMLCKSELAEAMEGYRKNLKDDKLPQYPMSAVELVDCIIRLLDLLGCRDYGVDTGRYSQALSSYQWCHNLQISANFAAALDNITDVISGEYWPQAIGKCEALFVRTYPDLSLREVYQAKRNFNSVRVDHTLEHRKSPHGKKF